MTVFKPLSTEANLGTDTAGASNVSLATTVRLFNTAAVGTEYLVTLEQSDGTDIGTFTLDGQQEAFIRKDSTDKLFAANANVEAVSVAVYG